MFGPGQSADGAQSVPAGVIDGIYDVEAGRTANVEDLDDALDLLGRDSLHEPRVVRPNPPWVFEPDTDGW